MVPPGCSEATGLARALVDTLRRRHACRVDVAAAVAIAAAAAATATTPVLVVGRVAGATGGAGIVTCRMRGIGRG